MKRINYMKAAVAAATVSVFAVLVPAFAQEESKDATAEKKTEESAVEAPAEKAEKKDFTLLVKCIRAGGTAQVLKPRTSDWVDVEEGRFYPLGSSFRVPTDGMKASAEFEFGEKSTMVLSPGAEVVTVEKQIGEQVREIVLKNGRVNVKLPRTLKEGLFFVKAPFQSCSNLAGESQYDYSATGDGDELVVRCITGSLALEGRHYKIARMGAANQLRLRTTGDDLFTSLRGESGDIKVVLDQGMGTEKNFETGEVKDVPKSLEFVLSPQCAIKIWRRKTGSGDRMAVSTMTFDPTGEMKNRCAFAEGLSFVNSGELVVAPKVASDVSKEQAKAEAEETETVEPVSTKKTDAEDSEAEEKKDDKKEEESSDL